MKKRVGFMLALSLGLLSEFAVAQKVTVDGEIRTRAEFRDGFSKPLADSVPATLFTSLRTRLNLSYTSEKINAKITLQDARNYGSTNLSESGTESFGVF